MARSTTSPRTEIPTREASDPPDDVDIWQRWTVGIGHGQPRRGADADFRYGVINGRYQLEMRRPLFHRKQTWIGPARAGKFGEFQRFSPRGRFGLSFNLLR